MPSFYALLDNATPFDPQRTFVTSWLIPPLALAILRLLFSLYAFTVTFTQWGILGARGDASVIGPEFSYFTNLTWWGISFYTLVAGVHTLFYALKGSSPLTSLPRPLQALHSFFYTTIITLPFLVTIVYWAVLYDGPWFTHAYNAWSNISHHALNSLVALVELLLPTTNSPPWLHLPGLILLLALYLSLAYLTHATQGFYTYNFLDPSRGQGRVAGYVFGILAGFVVIFLLAWGIVWARRRVTGGAGAGKRSRRDKMGDKGIRRGGEEDVEMKSVAVPK